MHHLGKICRDHWKDHFKINEMDKFESHCNLSTTNEGIAPQTGEMLPTFVLLGVNKRY